MQAVLGVIVFIAVAMIAAGLVLRSRAKAAEGSKGAAPKGKKGQEDNPLERIRAARKAAQPVQADLEAEPVREGEAESAQPESVTEIAPEFEAGHASTQQYHGFGLAYPVTIRPKAETRKAGALFCAWRDKLGLPREIPEGEWLPLGVVGPILVIAGTHADDQCPYPAWAVQRVIVSQAAYYEHAQAIAGQFVTYREEAESLTLPSAPAVDMPEDLAAPLDAAKFIQSHFPLSTVQASGLSAYLSSHDAGSLPGGFYAAIQRLLTKQPVCDPGAVSASVSVDTPEHMLSDQEWVFSEVNAENVREVYVAVSAGKPQDRLNLFFANLGAEFRQHGIKARFVACYAADYAIQRAAERNGNAGVRTAEVRSLAASTKKDEKALPVDFRILQRTSPTRNDATPAEIVQWIIAAAIVAGSSDIHIDTFKGAGRIRWRVDNIIRLGAEVRDSMLRSVVQQMRDASRVDVSINWMPQDGRCNVIWTDAQGREEVLDLRTSVYPNKGGVPTVTLRLLREKKIPFNEMGFTDFEREVLMRAARADKGFIIISGPTGSGKTTTLNAILNEINTTEVKICTAEDPVEYKMEGVSQGQIDTARGVTGTAFMRAMLRQDIDAALVGEIRDAEMNSLAGELSNTGHVVFATLHTNDVVSVISRLRDLGMRPADIAEAVTLAQAQRLVGKCCPECRYSRRVTPAEAAVFTANRLAPPAQIQDVKKNAECKVCKGTGVKGRAVVMELLPFTPEIVDAVIREAPLSEIRKIRDELGFPTLLGSALRRVALGEIAFSEAMSQQYLWDNLPTP